MTSQERAAEIVVVSESGNHVRIAGHLADPVSCPSQVVAEARAAIAAALDEHARRAFADALAASPPASAPVEEAVRLYREGGHTLSSEELDGLLAQLDYWRALACAIAREQDGSAVSREAFKAGLKEGKRRAVLAAEGAADLVAAEDVVRAVRAVSEEP